MVDVFVKFGVLCAVSGSDPSFSSGSLHDLLRRLKRAEEQGFESVWLTPGNLWKDESGYPLPLVAAHFAVQSQRVRIGLALPLTSRLHPLRLAEEIAALDVMTGGRLDWSAVYPGDAAEHESFLSEEDFREQLGIVKGAWTTDRFDWQGEAYAFSDIGCFPRPLQDPHPPTWLMTESPSLLSWAAAENHAVMVGPWSPLSDIEAQRRVLSESPASAGGGLVQAIRYVYVGKSVAGAREEAGPGLLRAYRERLLGPPAGFAAQAGGFPTPVDESPGFHESSDRLLEFLFENTVVVGDEVYCRDKVAEIRERLGVDSFLCCQDGLGLGSEALRVSQARWIDEVAPAFA